MTKLTIKQRTPEEINEYWQSRHLKDPVGIEFTDDIIVDGKTTRTFEHLQRPLQDLTEEFLKQLNGVEGTYRDDPNHERFEPLRKFYATALRNAYVNDKPEMNDPVFQQLQAVGIGIELQYYVDLRAGKLEEVVWNTMFIGEGKDLYHARDNRGFNHYRENGAEFGLINITNKIKEAEDPEGYRQELERFGKIWQKAAEGTNYKPETWTKEYNHRLFNLFGYPTRESEKTQEEFERERYTTN